MSESGKSFGIMAGSGLLALSTLMMLCPGLSLAQIDPLAPPPPPPLPDIECPYCDTVFHSQSALNSHVASLHSLPQGMEFASIPAGSFRMGAPDTEEHYTDEEPLHTVYLDAFEIMTTEVTQGMWEQVMGFTPASDRGAGADYPVYSVSWFDCLDFICEMNSMDARNEYRLPTEAEWEYACRAGTSTTYYWGNAMDERYCLYSEDPAAPAHEVGQRLPNPWGLFDMIGSVYEWCEDCYHENYSGAPSDGSAWIVPAGLYRVGRGGGIGPNVGEIYWRAAYRNYGEPEGCYNNYGFRLVRTAR